MQQLRSSFANPLDNLESVEAMLRAMHDVQALEAEFDARLAPVEDMYALLNR